MNQTVLDGSLLLAAPIAVLAGLVSFLSPCVLPLVPGYLGYVTGLTGVDLEQQKRGRMLAGVALFVGGFTVVYVAVGFMAGALGTALQAHAVGLQRVLGVLIIMLGLMFAGWLPGLKGSQQLSFRPSAGLAGAPLLGVVFGLGWTACTGPTLAAITGLGGLGGNPWRGALLATFYCVGLGIPFLVAAVAYRRAMGAFDVVRRHRVAVTRAGGLLLVALGVLLVTGIWGELVSRLQVVVSGFGTAV